jgi:carbamoylphosphate synthase small subunit
MDYRICGETLPGPHDSAYLFDRLANMMEEFKK